MLLPLGIEHPYERTPYATYALIAACVGIFGLQLGADDRLVGAGALDPSDVGPLQLITYAFLHGGVLHLLGNMWMLWVYGRYVEDRLGPQRFLLVYLGGAVAGGLAYVAGGSHAPVVGASGAIAALFGLVLVAAPWCQVLMRVLLNIFPVGEAFHVAAFWLLVPWIAFELLSVPGHEESGVAVLAHVGGFLGGAALGLWCRQPARKGTGWWLDPALPGGGEAARRRLKQARGAPAPTAGAGRTSRPPEEIAVVVRSLPAAVSRVAAVKLLMVHAGLEPDEAMERVKSILAGTSADVPVATREAAHLLQAGLRELGAETLLRLPPETMPRRMLMLM